MSSIQKHLAVHTQTPLLTVCQAAVVNYLLILIMSTDTPHSSVTAPMGVGDVISALKESVATGVKIVEDIVESFSTVQGETSQKSVSWETSNTIDRQCSSLAFVTRMWAFDMRVNTVIPLLNNWEIVQRFIQKLAEAHASNTLPAGVEKVCSVFRRLIFI